VIGKLAHYIPVRGPVDGRGMNTVTTVAQTVEDADTAYGVEGQALTAMGLTAAA
jgi:hypothetical protein